MPEANSPHVKFRTRRSEHREQQRAAVERGRRTRRLEALAEEVPASQCAYLASVETACAVREGDASSMDFSLRRTDTTCASCGQVNTVIRFTWPTDPARRAVLEEALDHSWRELSGRLSGGK